MNKLTHEELIDIIDIVAKVAAKKYDIKLNRNVSHKLINTIWMELLLKTINNPVRVHIGYGEGCVQVLQHESKRGYEWDKVYDFLDWTIMWATPYPHTKISFNRWYYTFIWEKTRRGFRYLTHAAGVKDVWEAWLQEKAENGNK